MRPALRWCAAVVPLGLAAALALALTTAGADRRAAAPAPEEVGGLGAMDDLIRRLRPLDEPLPPPAAGDWRTLHSERWQSFADWLAGEPTTARGARRRMYVLPLGDFSAAERAVLDRTVEFIGVHFGVPVGVLPGVALAAVPERARRVHPSWGDRQVLTTWVLAELLVPRLPDDAAALLALTTSDLWPGEGWNFVFGQASLRDRVGVWSMYRNGDPEGDAAERLRYLRRTLKTATHELGHMLSIAHDPRHACNMAGSNHREESDQRPLWLCAEDEAKVCHATGADPLARFRALEAWCRANGLAEEAAHYAAAIRALGPD